MLSKYYGFVVVNNTGQTLTYNSNGRINLKITPFYINSSTGKITYGTTVSDDCGFGAADSTADGGEDPSSEQDNSSNLYTNALVQLEITHDEGTAADGTYDIYYEGSDATGDLPSDQSGYDDAETNQLTFVGSLLWHSSGDDDEVMSSEVFVI